MKSRTSLFNRTVLLKDITRFCPIWIIFSVINLLPTLGNLSTAALMEKNYIAFLLGGDLGAYAITALVYALICALFLFGDLFKSKLCNALHALPLRRESWFATHFLAGVLFFLAPGTVNALICLPYMGEYWFVAPMWLLATTVMYLFFFTLAILCVMLTGGRFAAAAVYVLINFFSLLCYWMVDTYYAPLLPGLHIRDTVFIWFCPVAMLASGEYFIFDCVEAYPSKGVVDLYESMYYTYKYVFKGFGSNWLYIGIVAALAVVLFILALVLYRKRKLESAGDFLAFRKPQPVFLVIFSLTIGAIFQSIFGLFDSNIVSMIIGLVIGCYAGQMLLRRTVKVFDKRSLIWAGAMAAALGLTLVVTSIDPLGLTRWTPEPEQVVSIALSEDYEYVKNEYYHSKTVTIQDPGNIEKIVSVHEKILAEGAYIVPSQGYYGQAAYIHPIHLTYKLADGREVVRRYYVTDNTLAQQLEPFFSSNKYLLGYDDFDDFIAHVELVTLDSADIASAADKEALLRAVWADCEAGLMSQNGSDTQMTEHWITILTEDYYINLTVFDYSKNTMAWIHGIQIFH